MREGDADAVRTARDALRTAVALLHPFMPHITEEIHSLLAGGTDELLALAPFPEPAEPTPEDAKAAEDFELLAEAVRSVRRLRADAGVPAGAKVQAVLVAEGAPAAVLSGGSGLVARLAGCRSVEVASSRPAAAGLAEVGRGFETVLPLGSVEVEKARKRIEKELSACEKGVASLEARLSDPAFREKAPEEVVAGMERELEERKARRDRLRALAGSFRS